MEASLFANIRSDYLELLGKSESRFRRFFIDEIDWDERLIFLLGARGVGKTTLLLQHIWEAFKNAGEALYISMDDINLAPYSIIEIANQHFQTGGTHLFIDEIHKYSNWSTELKNINDRIKGLKVVVSGSSILEIQKGKADLSRRSVEYILPGLSFREFINIPNNNQFERVDLNELLRNHVDIAQSITSEIRPFQFFDDYLKFGYYPFYLEGSKNYNRKLNNVVNLTLEIDMPYLLGIDISKIPKIKKLIYILSTQVPFKPNVSKLAESLEIDRNTLNSYLHYLEKASILKLVWNKGKSYTLITKPDKIYLHNPNLFFISNNTNNTGTLRESFFVNQITYEHDTRLPLHGDFLVDDKYIFEIGGRKKRFKQIADIANSYVIADQLLIGNGNRIPLWLFGFLY